MTWTIPGLEHLSTTRTHVYGDKRIISYTRFPYYYHYTYPSILVRSANLSFLFNGISLISYKIYNALIIWCYDAHRFYRYKGVFRGVLRMYNNIIFNVYFKVIQDGSVFKIQYAIFFYDNRKKAKKKTTYIKYKLDICT